MFLWQVENNILEDIEFIFWAFLLACAAQSACCGLRYRFGAVRTMLAHALRMPNAKVAHIDVLPLSSCYPDNNG